MSEGKNQEVRPLFAEYIWVGNHPLDIRSKSRIIHGIPEDISAIPMWDFDGSSTGQSTSSDSDVILRPVSFFADPFMGMPHILVLCECLTSDGNPTKSNTRATCTKQMESCKDDEPWFGLEQEYTLFEKDGSRPLSWPEGGFPRPQGPYYCSVGTLTTFGREVKDAHSVACLRAGLNLSGTNAEVMPSQWEYQIGPCIGIGAGDQLTVSRFLLLRVCEKLNVVCTFDPKPVEGDWNGAGCHVNFSSKKMRNEGGLEHIYSAIDNLKVSHSEHITLYGEGNERRLTGKHATSSYESFTFGVANREASVRIPRVVENNGYGYLEDRRPASNIDPYVVTGKLVSTILLNDTK